MQYTARRFFCFGDATSGKAPVAVYYLFHTLVLGAGPACALARVLLWRVDAAPPARKLLIAMPGFVFVTVCPSCKTEAANARRRHQGATHLVEYLSLCIGCAAMRNSDRWTVVTDRGRRAATTTRESNTSTDGSIWTRTVIRRLLSSNAGRKPCERC